MKFLAWFFLFSATACFGSEEFTYDDLTRLIQDKGLKNIEAVLAELPPELRSNYTLLFESRSVQAATEENPRVILFGRNAKLTCTFNGENSQKGGDSIECFQFIDKERKFDFRAIQFPTPENGLTDVLFSVSNRSANGKMSCTGCHAADPRPHWDHMPTWPGAYGSKNDEILNEATPYAAFIKRRGEHPRYRWLLQGTNASDPFVDVAEGRVDVNYRPNLRFTEEVSRLNALRDLRILEGKVPSWQVQAFAVSALHCAPTADQLAKMSKAGLHFEIDSDLGKIFEKVGMDPNRWSTQIFKDPRSREDQPWEFQAGVGFLSQEIAMAVVQDLALAGDVVLQDAITRILKYHHEKPSRSEAQFFSDVNAIIPDIDFFGAGYHQNRDLVCPRLTEVFVGEYLKSIF